MKNFLIAFLVFLIWAFFALWLYSWLQTEDATSLADDRTRIETSSPTETEESTLSDVDGTQDLNNTDAAFQLDGLKALNAEGDIIFLYPETISIEKNSASVIVPKSIVDYKYKLNTYLVEHPNQELHILSKYSPAEQVATPNYGMQRGNVIKGNLMETGISHAKIVVKPMISDIEFTESNIARNGISFAFKPLDSTRYKKAKEAIYTETRILYPQFSMGGVLENNELQKFAEDAKVILEAHPDLRLKLIGHTDNVGNAVDNYRSGLKDAREVRWYMVNKAGIDRKKIVALSEGESNPLTTNRTEKGRTENRRIEAVFERINE